MKMKSIYLTVAVMLVAFSAMTAWPQATLSRVNGKVTDGNKPLAGVQITYTNLGTGNSFSFTNTNVVNPASFKQFYLLSSTNYNP